MAGFDMMGLMNDKSKAQAKQKYEMKTINIGQIIENPTNSKIYTTEDIEQLADSIELAGRVLQNLIVKSANEDGKYMLISGHRRWKACSRLVSRGKLEFSEVQCLIENEKDEDLQELMLIYTNSTARDMSDAEKMRQAEHATAVLTKMKQEKKLVGRVRDIAANMLKTTSGQLARYHAIMNNLKNEDLRAAFDAGGIGVSVAYEASRLSEEGQQKVALQLRSGEVTLQNIITVKMQEEAENTPDLKDKIEHTQEPQVEDGGKNIEIERREKLVLPENMKVEVTVVTKKTHIGQETEVEYSVRKGDFGGGIYSVGTYKSISEARAAAIASVKERHKAVAEALLKARYIQEMPEKYARVEAINSKVTDNRKASMKEDPEELRKEKDTRNEYYDKCLTKMHRVGYDNLEPCEQCTIATSCGKCCKKCQESCNRHQECKVEYSKKKVFVLKNIIELLQREQYNAETMANEDKIQGNNEGMENRKALADKLGEMLVDIQDELEEWEE